MMHQQFQQPQPPSKFNTFMEKFAWPTATGVVVAIIGTIILGKIQIVDFNWLMLILAIIMLGIMVFCIWYTVRIGRKLQEKHQEELATLKREYQASQNNYRDMANQEFNRLNDWSISFSQANAKEQREQFEELRRQCMEAITDAENRMDISVKNAQSIFSGSVQSFDFAVNSYRQQLIHALRQMDALKKALQKEPTPINEE